MQGDVGVSYHYTISQAADGGVTVCDVVDTDLASWSVGDANNFTINLCFAGSFASWTRSQWMAQSKAIDVAAYLAVQDSKKYGFSPLVVPPPYSAGTPGISDHKWVTQVYGWGTHTDVGNNFPWDYLAQRVAYWAGNPTTTPPVVTPPVNPPAFTYPSTDEMVKQIWEQLFGPQAKGWAKFGKSADGTRDKFTVEALFDLHDKAGS